MSWPKGIHKMPGEAQSLILKMQRDGFLRNLGRCILLYCLAGLQLSLSNRLDQIDYPRALANNLSIGSGLIESGHRHVLQARLKRAGTARLKLNAHNLAQLRVLRSNERWDKYWFAQKAA